MPRILFLLVISTIWALAHYYVGKRLITDSKAPRPLAAAGWSILVADILLSMLSVVGRFSTVKLPFAAQVQWLTYMGMGVFVLVLSLVFMRDMISLGWSLLDRFRGEKDEPVEPRPGDELKLTRRELFQRASSAGIVAASAGAATYGHSEARRVPRVKRVEVPVKGLDPALDGFHIVQISDVHLGPTIKGDFFEAVVAEINKLDADLVALTGDFVDGFVPDLREDAKHLADIKARHGLFYVNGNHEYYWDAPGWSAEVARLGGRPLHNAHEVISHNGAPFVVAGVNDYSTLRGGRPDASSPRKAIEGAPKDAFKLLLAHQPKSIYEASEVGFDLQLSGHTHGGQFWPWNLVVGLAHPFTAGLDRYEDRTWIYVSRGTGYWGPPLRLGAPSEITSIKLVAA